MPTLPRMPSSDMLSGARRGFAFDAAGVLSIVRGWVNRLHSDWAAHRRTNNEMGTLYGCTDFELRDMGLNRCDLAAIKRGTFRRD